jgi:predicted HTH transcriptional regulator
MREVVVEVEQIATDLNLSESQNKQLKSTLAQARENIQQYKQENPNVTREQLVSKIAANRGAIRERVGAFLTP